MSASVNASARVGGLDADISSAKSTWIEVGQEATRCDCVCKCQSWCTLIAVSKDTMSEADGLLWSETSGSVSVSASARVGGLDADISSAKGT